MTDAFDIFYRALSFSERAHRGMVRKTRNIPYILHPMEVAAIASNMTEDPEILAAALLHDTLEDTETTEDELLKEFGERVLSLVLSETENKRPSLPPECTWRIRKEESLDFLKRTTDNGVRILWLSDKLANMRSFYRLFLEEGPAFWKHFHESDPGKQEWYYRSVAAYTSSLSKEAAWQEYTQLLDTIFGGSV